MVLIVPSNFLMILQVGIQRAPDELNMKTNNLVLVNVLKNQVCNDVLKTNN